MNSMDVLAAKTEQFISFVAKFIKDANGLKYSDWRLSMREAFRGETKCAFSVNRAKELGLTYCGNGQSRVCFTYNLDGKWVVVKIPRATLSNGNEDELKNYHKMVKFFPGMDKYLCPILHNFKFRNSLILVVEKMETVGAKWYDESWYDSNIKGINELRYRIMDTVCYDTISDNIGLCNDGLLHMIDYNIIPSHWWEHKQLLETMRKAENGIKGLTSQKSA